MRAPWDTAGNRSWFAQCRHGGGSSKSSSSQSTSNADNRAAADTGSVSASGGATLNNVAVYNTSSDPAVIIAALQSVERQGIVSAGAVNDLAATALHENRALSQDAIDQWARIAEQSLSTGSVAITDAINAVAQQSNTTSGLASQALSQAAPLQSSLKVIIYAVAAVAIVFFLSRSHP